MKKIMYVAALSLLLASCTKEDDNNDITITPTTKTFKVVIENVSTAGTLSTSRLEGTAPVSHGVFAVYHSSVNPLFVVGEMADVGTERIAEDGFTTEKTNMLNNESSIKYHGEFVAPGGPDNGAALYAGESSMFFITADEGDKLQIQSMFIQSGDWFYAFDNGGLDLFSGSTPVSGDVTSKIMLYDAGTEFDEAPGVGAYQKPAQDPLDMNIGPADDVNTIQLATERHADFSIPPAYAVIKITITPQ